jgi:hypothetical protein
VGDLPPLRLYVLVLILVHTIGHFAYMGLWRHLTAPDFDVNDFKAYYTAAYAVRTGQAGRFLYSDPSRLNLGLLPDQPWVDFAVAAGAPRPSAYIYPPFFAVALSPLTLLPYHAANLAWFALNTALLAASILILLALARACLGELEALAAAAVVFVCLNFFPTIRAMQCGQTGFVLLFLISAALLSLVSRRDALAGACLALAAAIKLTPIVLLVWLAWAGRRRAAAWGAGLFMGLTAASAAAAGWSNLGLYVTGFLPTLSRGAATYANQSVNGFLNRLLTDQSMTVFGFSEEPAAVWWLTRAAAVLLLAGAFLAGRPAALAGRAGVDRRDETLRLSLGYSLVVLTSLLVSPISWEHHYVLALLPLAIAVAAVSRDGSAGALAVLTAAYVLMAVDAFELVRKDLPRGSRPAMSYVLFGGLLLWWLVASRLRRAAPRKAEA